MAKKPTTSGGKKVDAPAEDKKVAGPAETKKIETKTVSGDQGTLERNATFEGGARQDRTARRRVCYNRACPDYGRERDQDENCACRRTSVQPAAAAFPSPY